MEPGSLHILSTTITDRRMPFTLWWGGCDLRGGQSRRHFWGDAWGIQVAIDASLPISMEPPGSPPHPHQVRGHFGLGRILAFGCRRSDFHDPPQGRHPEIPAAQDQADRLASQFAASLVGAGDCRGTGTLGNLARRF